MQMEHKQTQSLFIYIICALIVLYYASQTFALFFNIVEMFYMTIIIGFKDSTTKKTSTFVVF